MRRLLIPTLLAMLAITSPARAAGGPVIGLDGMGGALSHDGSLRYYTLHESAKDTLLAQVSVRDGQVLRNRPLRGYWNVPAVAYDGTGGGLSADGRRLVLIEGQFGLPGTRSRLLVLGAKRIHPQKTITLRGEYGFDALSPDGSTLYLTHYRNGNPTDYEVRALDTRSGRLYPKPLVDPREPGEKMTGYPVTRAMSPDGRWAYTLYSGTNPFIHALDTAGRRAFCIDLDALKRYRDIYSVRLRIDRGGGRLALLGKGARPMAFVDAHTFKVSAPAARALHARGSADSGRWWLWLLAIPGGLLAAGLALRSRRLAGGVRAR
jgi:hypothetical protein